MISLSKLQVIGLLLACVLLLLVFAAVIETTRPLTSLAFAQSEPDTIYACVHKNNGNLRIVGPTESCKNNESPLSWGKSGGGGSGVSFYKVASKAVSAPCSEGDGFCLPALVATCQAGDIAINGAAFDNGTYQAFWARPYPLDETTTPFVGYEVPPLPSSPDVESVLYITCADIGQ